MEDLYIMIKSYHPDITASGNLIKNLVPYFQNKYNTTVLTNGKNLITDSETKICRFRDGNGDSTLRNRVISKLQIKRPFINQDMYSFLKDKISVNDKIILIPITMDEIVLALKIKKEFPDKVVLTPFLLEELLVNYSKSLRLKLKSDLEIYCDKIFILPKLENYFLSKNKVVILEHPMVKNEVSLEKNESGKIVYAGGLNLNTRNPESILIWFSSNKNIMKDFEFFSYGNCETLLQRYNKFDRRIHANGAISSDKVMKVMSDADFLVTIGNKNSNLVPSKIFDCISTGKPIVHFYYEKNDPYIGYLKDYRYSICLDINKINYEELNNFIANNSGKVLDFEEIKQNYYYALPQTVFERINQSLEEISHGS